MAAQELDARWASAMRPPPRRFPWLTVPRLVALLMTVILVVSLVLWARNRAKLPPVLRIASAAQGGLYHRFASVLAPHLENEARRTVTVLPSLGSVQNREWLLAGKAELALLQNGAVPLDGLRALTPLYYDFVFVVVRRGAGLSNVLDLAGRDVVLGPPGSGMRESAKSLLDHYGVTPSSLRNTDRYFLELLTDSELDAAIVTTGALNPDLQILLSSGEFDLLPILDADSLSIRHPHFSATHIPRGLFREGPPVPPAPVLTLRTTSFLAVKEGAPAALVEATLKALYQNHLRDEVTTLLPRPEAAAWGELPRHRAADSYFQPYGDLDLLANFMESLAALKELLFAFGAGLYLAFSQWRRLQRKRRDREAQEEKDRLDVFLEQTIRIERAQMDTQDPEALSAFLDEVTEIKLAALEQLTHEDLRGDANFSIFLQQCSNLIRKIQGKLLLVKSAR